MIMSKEGLKKIENEINNLTYNLYGLDKDLITIIENNINSSMR